MPHLILTTSIQTPFYQHKTDLLGLDIPEGNFAKPAEISTIYKSGRRRLEADEQINAVEFLSSRPLKNMLPIHQIALGALIVNADVKEVIVSFDGEDVHQFIPIEVTQKGKVFDGQYYLLNVYVSGRAIDVKSEYVRMELGFDHVERPKIKVRNDSYLDLLSDFTLETHAFRDGLFSSGNLIISDPLKEKLDSQKLLRRVPMIPIQS